jgi:adenine-specific DNA methylase
LSEDENQLRHLGNADNLRKYAGVYYTPSNIAEFLAHWAIRSPKSNVLEPSCGNGLLMEQAAQRLLELGASKEEIKNLVLGVEISNEETDKAISRLSRLGFSSAKEMVANSDFFEFCRSNLWDKCSFSAIIGNPPFIRYQQFKREREIAFELMREAMLNPNGHTNSWVPFLVVSSLLLDHTGRLAMVIPAELFQVKYAAETRKFLSEYYNKLTIITFKKLVLGGPLQEIVILLGERNTGNKEGIRVVELEDAAELIKRREEIIENSAHPFLSTETKPLNHGEDKWTQYFLEKKEILLLRDLIMTPNLTRCKNLFNVDIGVVTGRNRYFVLDEPALNERKLKPFSAKIITGSAVLRGIRFSYEDWQNNLAQGRPSFLFKPPEDDFGNFPSAARDYIQEGEKDGVNRGFKCRIRDEWYRVPTIWPPEGFIIRQIHEYPRIVLNETDATCTDTIHRISFTNREERYCVTAAFLNSLTFAFAEVIGRSYGGGILLLEPSEAERLPIPITFSERLDFGQVDKLIRENNIDEVLAINDRILLKEGLGLAKSQINMLKSIWKKMRDRRLNRRRQSS